MELASDEKLQVPMNNQEAPGHKIWKKVLDFVAYVPDLLYKQH